MPAKSAAAAANQKAAQDVWHRLNYDQLKISVPKGKREEYKALAAARGVSLTQLITGYLDSLAEEKTTR